MIKPDPRPAPSPLAKPEPSEDSLFDDPLVLLTDLLAVSITAVNLISPVYNTSGKLVDFNLDYVNPSGQRMTGLPERPGTTLLKGFPHTSASGIFEFYRSVYEDGLAETYAVNYQADGLDNYFQLAACRSGNRLVVSFTDTADQPRTAVELALRDAQAREQVALAKAELQSGELQRLFEQAPVSFAVLQGPEYVVELANPTVLALWGRTAEQTIGTPLFELLPEIQNQGFKELLDGVRHSQQPVEASEMEAQIYRQGRRDTIYVNFVYYPKFNDKGVVVGIIVMATDSTEQVLARRALQGLNQELESRVAARTREAEAARADAENQRNRLHALFAQVPTPINIHTGPDHVFEWVHPRTAALLGQVPLVGLSRRKALPHMPEHRHTPFDEAYRTGKPFRQKEVLSKVILTPGDSPTEAYFDITYQPLFDAEGKVEGVMSFSIDVTEQVRAREQADELQARLLTSALRQAQEREAFFRVFEQTPALIQLLRGPEHIIEYVNPAYQSVFPGKQLIGRKIAESLPELSDQGFLDLIDQVFQSGETYYGTDMPFLLNPPDGPPHTRYYTFTYQAYQEEGQTAGIALYASDVTEQVLARQERENQRRQIQDLFMQAPAAIAILAGPTFIYELVNPAYQQLFAGRELSGRQLADVFPELESTGIFETFQDVYETGISNEEKGIEVGIVNSLTGQSEQRYFNYIQQARYDQSGDIDGVIIFAFEVTAQVLARKHVEDLNRELSASNQKLVRTNADLDTFIYTASHDLKAPITNIEGLLTALSEQLPDEAKQADTVPYLFELMHGAVERFQLTIRQLSDIARLQKVQDQPAEIVDLAQIVEAVRLDLAPLLTSSRAELFVDLKKCPTVRFAPQNLRSIVYNLLSNAVKYRDPDRTPRVHIRCFQGVADMVVLEIEDNGLGLDTNQQGKLFGLFRRLHTHVEGSGIGLYMVKKIIDNAGGNIEVRSEPGVGTVFMVTLPA